MESSLNSKEGKLVKFVETRLMFPGKWAIESLNLPSTHKWILKESPSFFEKMKGVMENDPKFCWTVQDDSFVSKISVSDEPLDNFFLDLYNEEKSCLDKDDVDEIGKSYGITADDLWTLLSHKTKAKTCGMSVSKDSLVMLDWKKRPGCLPSAMFPTFVPSVFRRRKLKRKMTDKEYSSDVKEKKPCKKDALSDYNDAYGSYTPEEKKSANSRFIQACKDTALHPDSQYLVFDSHNCYSTQRLIRDANVDPCRIIVPNPDPSIAEVVSKKGAVGYTGMYKNFLVQSGAMFRSRIGGLFLDACCTASGNSQVRILDDIHHTFGSGILGPMFCIATTICRRVPNGAIRTDDSILTFKEHFERSAKMFNYSVSHHETYTYRNKKDDGNYGSCMALIIYTGYRNTKEGIKEALLQTLSFEGDKIDLDPMCLPEGKPIHIDAAEDPEDPGVFDLTFIMPTETCGETLLTAAIDNLSPSSSTKRKSWTLSCRSCSSSHKKNVHPSITLNSTVHFPSSLCLLNQLNEFDF